jgi:Na+/H+ antiporter NhaC
MMRPVLRWMAALVLAGLWYASTALAQNTTTGDGTGDHPPTSIPYAVALILTIIVMLIVCLPSRKQPG